MRLAMIGKFRRLHDEEYIARSFEAIGVNVLRVDERELTSYIKEAIDNFEPDYVLWFKLSVAEPVTIRDWAAKYKTICWVFDLYWGYQREYRLTSHPAFTADYVFTTDGGHQDQFEMAGIKHQCVRQGIYEPECRLLAPTNPQGIVFVGSENVLHPSRAKQMSFLEQHYPDFKWLGRLDSNAVRGMDLNQLYAKTKIVVGDSVPSPHYWSNRVVETLGRGGFLIHQEVAGLREEYPYLPTYEPGNFQDLKEMIDLYLGNEATRREVIDLNFNWVRQNYTMDKQCQKLLNYIS